MKNFHAYYNTFFEKVYRYLFFRAGRNKELAEDMTSEVFLKALESFENFDHRRPFAVWIYRIAHNHLVDYYKKAKAEIVPIEDAENDLRTLPTVEKDFDVKLDLERIGLVLDTLPAQQKEVVMMKYFNDLTNPEIADVLSLSEAHIRVLQHRALQSIKTKLSFLTA